MFACMHAVAAQSSYQLASSYRTQPLSVAQALQMSVQPAARVPLQEATISGLQRLLLGGNFTCSDIVQGYVQVCAAHLPHAPLFRAAMMKGLPERKERILFCAEDTGVRCQEWAQQRAHHQP